MIEFLLKYKSSLVFSVDNPEKIYDQIRKPGSYKRVIKKPKIPIKEQLFFSRS
ncbi:MAG: hypothetical protein ACTSR7_14920 [Promethearchaeota archaeon]